MIAHIVLFRPRADLHSDEHRALVALFEEALRHIPAIRRARVGKRLRSSRPYEGAAREDYQYVAVFEFDDLAGLATYLDHPSHAQLAGRFMEACEQAVMYDFELNEGTAELGLEPAE